MKLLSVFVLFGLFPSSTSTGDYLFVTVRSEGCDDQGRVGCGTAMMQINYRTIRLPYRGHSILVFDERTGRETSKAHFDTYWSNFDTGGKMTSFIRTIPTGSIVLVAVGDSASRLETKAEAALRSIGAIPPIDLKLRETWALIGRKGDWRPWIVQAYSPRYAGPTIITQKIPLTGKCSAQETCPGCKVPTSNCYPCKQLSCKSFPSATCKPDKCSGGCRPMFFNGNVKINCDILRVRILSEGCDDSGRIGCGRALIQIWGKEYSLNRRGHNIVVINSHTGRIEASRNFDTHGDQYSGVKMRNFLQSILHYKIVVIATADAFSNYEHAAHNELQLVGAGNPLDPGFRGSWVLVSRRGGRPAWFRQAWNGRYHGPTEVVVDIPLV